MVVNFDIKKINSVLQDFNNVTGIRIDLIGADFTPISCCEYENNNYCNLVKSCPAGKRACAHSDMMLLKKCQESRKLEIHVCHAGLVDVIVPIIYLDEIIGYLIFGQMRANDNFASIVEYLSSLGLNIDFAQAFFNSLPLVDEARMNSISNIASLLVKYILLENMLKPDLSQNMQRTIQYIDENLDKPLSVKNISKNVNVSKSVLYKNFHSRFNCTLSEYINSQRIERSTLLLLNTDLSIDEISQRVGFSNASYFSKTFKKQMGTSPLRYRKTKLEN